MRGAPGAIRQGVSERNRQGFLRSLFDRRCTMKTFVGVEAKIKTDTIDATTLKVGTARGLLTIVCRVLWENRQYRDVA